MSGLPVVDRLRLERMIEQGVDLDALEVGRVAQNLQEFQVNAQRVDALVLERLNEAKDQIGEFDQDLEAMPFLEGERLQCDALMRAQGRLEEVQDGLYEKLEAGEREFQILELHTQVLRKTVQALNKSLEAAKGRYTFERPLYNAGAMVSMSIAKPINK
jgi:hypothetical protein